MALLTVLPNPPQPGYGAGARRARDPFAPEVVMAAQEELFEELTECRRHAPAEAHCARPVSPNLTRSAVCGLCITCSWRHSSGFCFN